jgi:hypothetical protein
MLATNDISPACRYPCSIRCIMSMLDRLSTIRPRIRVRFLSIPKRRIIPTRTNTRSESKRFTITIILESITTIRYPTSTATPIRNPTRILNRDTIPRLIPLPTPIPKRISVNIMIPPPLPLASLRFNKQCPSKSFETQSSVM